MWQGAFCAIPNSGSEVQMNIVKQMLGLPVISELFARPSGDYMVDDTEAIPVSSRERRRHWFYKNLPLTSFAISTAMRSRSPWASEKKDKL